MIQAVAPEVLWAQRSSADEAEKNVVMMTINVPNLPSNAICELTPTTLDFKASVPEDKGKGIVGHEYAFKFDFFAEIDVESSKKHQTSKSLYLVLRKKEVQLEYWPRLSKEKVRLHNVKTDFDKWVDEDEQAEAEDVAAGMPDGMGGMDPSMMGGMGGMPGMGGAGGMGGMDLQAMMQQMGGGAGGMPDFGDMGAEDDDSDDGEEVAEPVPEPSVQEAAPVHDVESVD